MCICAARDGFPYGEDLVVESEGALPSGKVTASLSHAGAVPGFKASLSGQPADVSTAKLAMQLLRSGDLLPLAAHGP